jgi:hypothetical protein
MQRLPANIFGASLFFFTMLFSCTATQANPDCFFGLRVKVDVEHRAIATPGVCTLPFPWFVLSFCLVFLGCSFTVTLLSEQVINCCGHLNDHSIAPMNHSNEDDDEEEEEEEGGPPAPAVEEGEYYSCSYTSMMASGRHGRRGEGGGVAIADADAE